MTDVAVGWKTISDGLIEIHAGGRSGSMLKDDVGDVGLVPADARQARLLPAFDTYLLGYRDRQLAVGTEHARRVLPGGGILRPTVISSGRAIGTWTLHRSGGSGSAAVHPFEDLDPAMKQELLAEVEDIGRFLGRDIRLS